MRVPGAGKAVIDPEVDLAAPGSDLDVVVRHLSHALAVLPTMPARGYRLFGRTKVSIRGISVTRPARFELATSRSGGVGRTCAQTGESLVGTEISQGCGPERARFDWSRFAGDSRR